MWTKGEWTIGEFAGELASTDPFLGRLPAAHFSMRKESFDPTRGPTVSTLMMFLSTLGESDRLRVCHAYTTQLVKGRPGKDERIVPTVMESQEQRVLHLWQTWLAENQPDNLPEVRCCRSVIY